jgi:hypothetical protein
MVNKENGQSSDILILVRCVARRYENPQKSRMNALLAWILQRLDCLV